ncbi:hypothetical protein EDB83DRAFT_2311471 [Lactarius deliciosus]|nr:hypothetical protein EDB83DRAFT_2311471 [Lactarius deliciosus]
MPPSSVFVGLTFFCLRAHHSACLITDRQLPPFSHETAFQRAKRVDDKLLDGSMFVVALIAFTLAGKTWKSATPVWVLVRFRWVVVTYPRTGPRSGHSCKEAAGIDAVRDRVQW